MRNERLNNVAARETQGNIKKDPNDFVSEVISKGGKEIKVKGVIRMTKRGTFQFLTAYVSEIEKTEILFNVVHKEVTNLRKGKGGEEWEDDRLRLAITTEDSICKLREKWSSDVKITGRTDFEYAEMLSKAREMHLEPFGLKSDEAIPSQVPENGLPEDTETESEGHAGKVRFKRFVKLALENNVEEITVEPYRSEKRWEFNEKGKLTKNIVFGMKIQTILPDGKEILVCQPKIEVSKDELVVKGFEDLIALKLFLTSSYYSLMIREKLNIPAKGPVNDMDRVTREEMIRSAEENNIEPFDFPELSEFLDK